jgi:hypothetical protein
MSKKQVTHTPGPWAISKVIKHGARYYRTIRQEGKFKLAEVFAFNEGATGSEQGRKEDQANARLIASAPELLEQCKLFEKLLSTLIIEGHSGADLERDNLRAILDRVEGEIA